LATSIKLNSCKIILAMRALLTFFFLSQIQALKLLTTEDQDPAPGVDQDWEWEADLTFAYKPLQGKCLDAGGATPDKTDGSHYAGGKLLKKDCTENLVGKADFATYCKASKKEKLFEVLDAWIKILVDAKTFSKMPHYIAKLCAMDVLNDATNTQTPKSFDIKMDDGTYNIFKEAATKGKGEAGIFCYTTVGMMWAKNDPKVKNMDGEEFEIMATGTFALVSFKKLATQTTALEILSTIDRAGTRCGATYIQNITLLGQWVEDIGVPQIQVRAEASVPKGSALQVNFDGSWKSAAQRWSYSAVKEATNRKFVLNLDEIEIFVTIDSHRIHETGVKTKRFANFLNVNLNGISRLAGFSVGGLLGRDSHTEAAQIPEGCESSALLVQDAPRGLSQIVIGV